MKCVMCGRALFNVAALAAGRPVGPKCAKRAGLLTEAKREAPMRLFSVRPPPLLNPAQMLLFNEYAPSF